MFQGNRRLDSNSFSNQERQFIGRVFDRFALPCPDHGEYVSTLDGCLVPITFAGCLVRISRIDKVSMFAERKGRHENILQPLGFFTHNNCAVSFYPGVVVPALRYLKKDGDEEDIKLRALALSVSRTLSKSGFKLDEPISFNIGLLPKTANGNWPQGIPVSIDLDNVVVLSRIAVDRATPVQDRLYGRLKLSFQPAASGSPQLFWRECVSAKQSGVLISDWEYCVYQSSYPTVTSLPHVARAYDDHISRSGLNL